MGGSQKGFSFPSFWERFGRWVENTSALRGFVVLVS